MMTSAQLIDGLGGSAKVAEFMGMQVHAVSNWRKRGVPAWARQTLQLMCKAYHLDHDGALDPLPPRRRAAG